MPQPSLLAGLMCARCLIDGDQSLVLDGPRTGVREARLMMAIPPLAAAATA
ncbi:MAG: hypothetical protein RL033_4764, partial [Pseudomonadota bacterium]